MNQILVMTLLGQDRPGLVEMVARLVNDHQGNWLESRVSHLGGQFAGILRVAVPEDQADSLLQALGALASQGLKVLAHPAAELSKPSSGALVQLEIVGQDRPGIIRQISHTLAAHQVNVEELDTECSSAPMSGETLFTAKARLRLPSTPAGTADLQKALETIAADLMVECSFAPLEEAPPTPR